MGSGNSFKKKIKEITDDNADEPNLYGAVRDLLTHKVYNVGLFTSQVVVDSKLDNSRRRPDLVVYRAAEGKALRGPDYAIAVFEVKTGSQVSDAPKPIAREKRAYVQAGTRWFFLIDQRVVTRIDVTDRQVFESALSDHKPLPANLAKTWGWEELCEPDKFADCFGVLSAEHIALERELECFRAGSTSYAFLSAAGEEERQQFAATVRGASELIRAALGTIIEQKGVVDLRSANAVLQPMIDDYGPARISWGADGLVIAFDRITSEKLFAELSEENVLAFEERYATLMADLEPFSYALRIEHELLPQYAERQGIEDPSLLKIESTSKGPNNVLVQSLVYETGSLILSRMLMIRFCEDYGLFRVRYISNGGIEVFWSFADHLDLPMQELLRQTYKHARHVFRSIFDPGLLDWAVRRDDEVLSDALIRAAYVLSRWNFSTVRGDILSGVYDQYLDVSQRRRLGEVYTRPEVARFMLKAAEWKPNDSVLDPACGTGTFLVEALVGRLEDLNSKGAINDANVRAVIEKLHGLDISSFSIALAQIQVFWHLIELMKDRTANEAREFARSVLPVLQLFGGWSSLDPMGMAFGEGESAGEAAQTGLVFRVAQARHHRPNSRTMIPPGFERTAKRQFDLVIMNPPYIRSERSGSTSYASVYSEVSYKNTDTATYFIYRALKQWVRDGGRLAFIVPIGIMEAAYAGPLRRLLEQYKIKLIADLEGLGKTTFRGIKRPTVIVVVEKTAADPEQDVEVLQLGPTAVVDDVVDFDKAVRTTIKRRQLDRLSYVPTVLRRVAAVTSDSPEAKTDPIIDAGADSGATETLSLGAVHATSSSLPREPGGIPIWFEALRSNEDGADALLTKFADGDAAALETMAELPRLGEIVRIVWVRRDRGKIVDVLDTRPTSEAYRYSPELLFSYGVKMGGGAAFCQPGDTDCLELYKGQNVFPQGLLGDPMGKWSPTARRESTRYIYSYYDQLSYQNAFAIRKLSQLPTAAQITDSYAFQDTVLIAELTEEFPLNSYLLSRVVQFFTARVLRSSIIEDLGCTWSKRTLVFLPIPPNRTQKRLSSLRTAGEAVLEADSDIADRYRVIDTLKSLGTLKNRDLNGLIVEDDEVIQGIDLNGVSEKPVKALLVREAGDTVQTSDLFFRLVVPNADLRTYVAHELARRVEDDPDAELARDDVLTLPVPTNLSEVAKAIRSLSDDDLSTRYLEAMDELDRIVAEMCNIPDNVRDHMITAMTKDPILSKMRPMIAQRGLRVQPYADHSEGDRYA